VLTCNNNRYYSCVLACHCEYPIRLGLTRRWEKLSQFLSSVAKQSHQLRKPLRLLRRVAPRNDRPLLVPCGKRGHEADSLSGLFCKQALVAACRPQHPPRSRIHDSDQFLQVSMVEDHIRVEQQDAIVPIRLPYDTDL
jgi:hypothetical protein